jgi:autophagy-related protein 18
MIYDATAMTPVNVIDAHQTPLSCIALNNEGTLLATASEKGTIIRVFSLPDVQKLYQFRRGSIPARIYSMSFNATSTLLCVSSATETVHIFRLSPQSQNGSRPSSSSRPTGHGRQSSIASAASMTSADDEVPTSPVSSEYSAAVEAERRPFNPTLAGMLRRTSQSVGKSVAASIGGYLPSSVTEMWEPARDFAWVKIPRGLNASSPGGAGQGGGGSTNGPLRTVVAMAPNGPQVMVVTSEGNLFYFNIDLEKGGEGTLVKQVS